MPELSIIVPVYNVEQYLGKCLDSIQNQRFKDFETILIDDGSTDGSGAICDEYAARDNRFIVIHQENKGVSNARNAGLEFAKGQYYGLIDADDQIEPDMFENMIRTAKEYKADIVACDYRQINGNDHRPYSPIVKQLCKEELLLDVFSSPSLLLGVCWNKLFSSKCLSGLRFNTQLRNYEDTMFLWNSYLKCDKAVYLSEKYYLVTVRDDSASRKKDSSTIYEKCRGCIYLYRQVISNDVSKEVKKKVADKTLDSLLKYAREARSLEMTTNTENLLRKIKWDICKISMLSFIKGNLSFSKTHGYINSAVRL